MKKPKVIIIQEPDGFFRIQELVTRWFGLCPRYEYRATAYTYDQAIEKAERVRNPVVKEYE